MRCCVWVAVIASLLCSAVYSLPVNGTSEEKDPSDVHSSPSGYVRMSLDLTKCPNTCSGRGHCVLNTAPDAPPANTTMCICDQGWGGYDCSAILTPGGERAEGDIDCPNHCSSHGVCHRGSSVVRPRCYCDPHYTGMDCSQVTENAIFCPNNCSGFGLCTEGWSDRYGAVVAACMCDANHRGEDCSIEVASPCKNGCSGNGVCTAGGCACDQGFIGSDCSLRDIPQCLNNCSSRGRCLQGTCYCYQGYAGADCAEVAKGECPRGCGGHGRCVADTQYFPGGCACDKGWLGDDCSIPKLKSKQCYLDCSGRGVCFDNGTCLCEPQYAGLGCEFAAPLPTDLIGDGEALHPLYMDKKVMSQSDLERTRIIVTEEHPLCPNNCSSHGVCEEVITDELNVYHTDGRQIQTETVKLPTMAKQFVCRCDPGFGAKDCSLMPRAGQGSPSPVEQVTPARQLDPSLPQPNHLFAEDTTQWDKLPSATQLKIKQMPCPNNCSSRGRCLRDERGYPFCSCYSGWTAYDCSTKTSTEFHCPLDCSSHGKCVTASEYFPVHCMCDQGWHGENCEKPNPIKVTYQLEEEHEGFCPNHCSYRGICMGGRCVCMEIGWGGADCSLQAGGTCKDNCNGNGMCFWGTCECMGGYSGELCDMEPRKPCPNNCKMHGKCVGGQCICMTGFTGDDCSDILVECPHHCSGHGECVPADVAIMRPARCECNEGFTGHDCSNFPQNATPPPVETGKTSAQKALEKEKIKQEAKGKVSENPQ